MNESPKKPRRPAPLFLAPGAGGNDTGYRTRPLRPLDATMEADSPEVVELIAGATRICDEPECIGPGIVDAYGEDAKFYESQRAIREAAERRQARVLLTAEDRLKTVMENAKRRHIDVSHEAFIMRRDLERARLAGRKEPASVLARLERTEAKVDGLAA